MGCSRTGVCGYQWPGLFLLHRREHGCWSGLRDCTAARQSLPRCVFTKVGFAWGQIKTQEMQKKKIHLIIVLSLLYFIFFVGKSIINDNRKWLYDIHFLKHVLKYYYFSHHWTCSQKIWCTKESNMLIISLEFNRAI